MLQGTDLLVKSPGVPGETPLVAGARDASPFPVWSEIELGARLLPNPILGVTGTNGKTTTSELLGAMFRAAEQAGRGRGNIGRPLTSLVGVGRPGPWIVCELSSFQLEDVETAPAAHRVSCSTSSPTTSTATARSSGMSTRSSASSSSRRRTTPRSAARVRAGPGRRAARVEFDVRRPAAGRAAASPARTTARTRPRRPSAARAAGIGDDAIAEALRTFPGVPHRIELVRELDGIRYVNDSKATNVAAARRALASVPGRRLHVILGGRGKAEPYAPLAASVQARRPRVSHRRGGGRDRRRARPRPGVPNLDARRSPGRARGPRPGRQRPATSSSSRLRARASTSSRTSRRAATRSGASWRSFVKPSAEGRFDQRLLTLVTLGLVAFGLVMVYSATSAVGRARQRRLDGVPRAAGRLRDPRHRPHGRCVPLRLPPPALPVARVAPRGARALRAVLVASPAVNGAHRWFILGPASFQPSELAKLSLCIFTALIWRGGRRRVRSASSPRPLGIVTGIFCALILLEPDLGTTISLCVMMLARAPRRRRADAAPRRARRPRPSASGSSRSGSSRTGGRASSASSTPGATRRARASRSCRRRSASARAG